MRHAVLECCFGKDCLKKSPINGDFTIKCVKKLLICLNIQGI